MPILKGREQEQDPEIPDWFSGTLVSDAFSGYKSLDKNNENIHSAFYWDYSQGDYAKTLTALIGEMPQDWHRKRSRMRRWCRLPGFIKRKRLKEHISAAREIEPLVEAYFAWVHQQDTKAILSQKGLGWLKL